MTPPPAPQSVAKVYATMEIELGKCTRSLFARESGFCLLSSVLVGESCCVGVGDDDDDDDDVNGADDGDGAASNTEGRLG